MWCPIRLLTFLCGVCFQGFVVSGISLKRQFPVNAAFALPFSQQRDKCVGQQTHNHTVCESILNEHGEFDGSRAREEVLRRTEAAVNKTMDMNHSATWMIVGGKLYLSKKEHEALDVAGPDTNMVLMAKFISSVLENSCDTIPDVTFKVVPGSLGTDVARIPTLAIARKPRGAAIDTRGGAGRSHGGILVPNPYFKGIRQWDNETSYLLKASREARWESKSDDVFWRGQLCGVHTGEGNRERNDAARLSNDCPEKFNMLLLDMPGYQPKYFNFWSRKDKYCQHKYLMNLPGGKRGSYSQNLNHLWSTGSLVMQWESENTGHGLNWEEWYYPGLANGVTHLEVGKHNIHSAVDCLRTHAEIAHKIAKRSTQVHDAFLCPCCLSDHFVKVFQMLGKKVRFSPKDVLARDLAKDRESWVKQGVDKKERSNGQCMCSGTKDVRQ